MVDWNQDIAHQLIASWRDFFVQQNHLFRENAGEVVISTAFAPFLTPLCRDGLLINTEYDKMNDDLRVRIEKALLLGDEIDPIKPDIIIHQPNRDDPDGNLLAVELKKWNNSDWHHDEDKLIEMRSPPAGPRYFQYRFGLLLRFHLTGEIGGATLYRQGEPFYLNPQTMRL